MPELLIDIEGIHSYTEVVADLLKGRGTDLIDVTKGCLDVPRACGGNSSTLWLVAQGEASPAEVTELRCGEVLLSGLEALHCGCPHGCREEACLVRAEVVEEYTKQSAGGPSRRLVLTVGRRDPGAGAVKLLQPGLREMGRSSDCLVVEADGSSGRLPAGLKLDMIPEYEALVAAWMYPCADVRPGEV